MTPIPETFFRNLKIVLNNFCAFIVLYNRIKVERGDLDEEVLWSAGSGSDRFRDALCCYG